MAQSFFQMINSWQKRFYNYFNKDLTSVNVNYMENLSDPNLLLFILSIFKKAKLFIYEIG